MAFRFPLATVLRYRESVEKREELALQKVQLEIAVALRLVEELSEQIARASEACESKLRRTINANEMQVMLCEVNTAAAAKQSLMRKIQILEQTRAEQLRRYHAAYNGRQMLSDMHSKQQIEYEQEQSRSQQKSLDDIFGTRSQRK